MGDRRELLESALDNVAEGVVLTNDEGCIALWNRPAEAITGYPSGEIVGKRVREMLDRIVVGGTQHWLRWTDAESASRHGSLIQLRHKMGRQITVMARVMVLRDSLGARIGTGAIFRSTENFDALPHGEFDEASEDRRARPDFDDRLARMHEDSLRSRTPFGVLWVAADQARGLRRTHGVRAVEAMLEKMENTLATALKSGEEIGRWGEDEFLVISRERNVKRLAEHGEILRGLARTTEFRWWGDRISLTVSIGLAQLERGESLAELLERAQEAMHVSLQAGGNQITAAPGRRACSPL